MPKCLYLSWTKLPVIILILLISLGLAGCASGGGVIPEAVSVNAYTYNEGAVESQYAVIEIGFAAPVQAKSFKPEIKIAGERVSERALEISGGDGGRSINLKIRVVTGRDAEFTVLFGDQQIEGILPSGLTLVETGREPGSVTVMVTHGFNIRCIAWILLLENGEAPGGSLLAGADERDGAIALHGHEFLTDDEYAIAARLAETLTNHYGDRFSFTAEGKSVTAESFYDTQADLSLTVWEPIEIPISALRD